MACFRLLHDDDDDDEVLVVRDGLEKNYFDFRTVTVIG